MATLAEDNYTSLNDRSELEEQLKDATEKLNSVENKFKTYEDDKEKQVQHLINENDQLKKELKTGMYNFWKKRRRRKGEKIDTAMIYQCTHNIVINGICENI